MVIKDKIEEIYKKHTNYNEPDQAINQAESLKSLSSDLYTDSKRFIYELLQNADDSANNGQNVNVNIKLFEDTLVIAHTGKIFTDRDVQGLCSINNGTKKSDTTKTGYKGIGFKSVFGQSDEVTIFTNNEYFKFDANHPIDWNWDGSQEEWESENDREFLYPWQIIPIFIEAPNNDVIQKFFSYGNWNVATIIKVSKLEEIKKAIEELSSNVNMFLFLKNINAIKFETTETTLIEIERNENELVLKKDNVVKVNWLVKTIKLFVHDELKQILQADVNIPKKLKETDNIELTLAIKKTENGLEKLSNNENLLYAYLPTDEKRYKLPVLVNSTFLTSANRESLHTNSKWNQWLFKSISMELFIWIAELVKEEYSHQAYNLIPSKLNIFDDLSNAYDKGIDEAIESIPFILSKENKLLKVNEAIVDKTKFFEKDFIGSDIIKKFVKNKIGDDNKIVENPFIPNINVPNIGINTFTWNDVSPLFAFDDFKAEHNVEKNIQLIEYFKNESTIPNSSFPKEKLINWTFLYDHKGKLNYLNKICFPKIDDNNWNNIDSDLDYVNETLYNLSIEKSDLRLWLQKLGVEEKTDITYLNTVIIPNTTTYCTEENHSKTIKYIYDLYSNEDIKSDKLDQLTDLNLLTTKGSLISASECYFSNEYNPKLEIENILDDDVFLSQNYLGLDRDKEEVKRFFKLLGVQDSILIINISDKTPKNILVQRFKNSYFVHSLNTYGMSTTDYRNIISLKLLSKTNNLKFSKQYWLDVVKNISIEKLKEKATGYWGYTSQQGQTSGNTIENYILWYIKSNKCIPTTKGTSEKSIEVFLNTDDIKEIAGKYLSVFDGVELNQEWKSFFQFKTVVELDDYLELLTNIMNDKNDEEKIKKDNNKRVQLIYKALLEQSTNWGTEDIEKVKSWGTTAFLTDEDDNIILCNELKYYADGDNSIFQNHHNFIALNEESKAHSNIETFLGYLGVEIFRQKDFELGVIDKETSTLNDRLEVIFPYLEKWLIKLSKDIDINSLQTKLDELEIYEEYELSLKYNNKILKIIQIYLTDNELIITTPWNSNKVMMSLPKVLCSYFEIKGYEDKLEFLLRESDLNEVNEYFENEKIDLPIIVVSKQKEKDTYKEEILTTSNITEKEYDEISNNSSYSDKEKYEYITKLLPRAKSRILEHLKSLDEYNCDNVDSSLPTVLSGITKNGNNIYIVPRPSDNNKVHLYYSSELDTLEYSDSEVWYENGTSIPKKLTFGKVLRDKKIRKITIVGSEQEKIIDILNNPKNEEVAYTTLPPAPFDIAKTMASLANTSGGYFIIGYSEENGIVEFSTEFNVNELTQKAIEYSDYFEKFTFKEIKIDGKKLFIINVEKSKEDILIDDKKYIRMGSLIKEELVSSKPLIITEGKTDKTILEIAWQKLYNKEMPFVIQSSGVEIEEEKREGSADSVKRTIELMSGTFDKDRILIGLFDNDIEGNNNFKGLTKKAFEKYNISLKQRKHLTKNIYALLLPVPECRKIFVSEEDIGQRMFVIEHYFTNEILQRHQMKGKPLFGSKVFKVNNGKAKFSRDIEKLDKKEFEDFKFIFDVIEKINND